jgi:hypothetical protein
MDRWLLTESQQIAFTTFRLLFCVSLKAIEDFEYQMIHEDIE